MSSLISIIVCARNEALWPRHEANIARSIGHPYEYVRVDNRTNAFSMCSAYNAGVARAAGDILVFMHEDVFMAGPGWGGVLRRIFDADATVGLVGVAGSQFLSDRIAGWCAGGRPHIHGKVIHQLDGRLLLTVYSWVTDTVEAAAVDGLFFAVRRSLFSRIRFDDATFDGFHFYDLDICMQVRETHRVMVTGDIIVKHLSRGSFDQTWMAYADKFLSKYRGRLPVSITGAIPDLDKPSAFDTIDVTERLPQLALL